MKIRHDLNQGTKEWFEAKLGCITGTVLSDIVGTPKAREGALYELLGETLTPSVDMEYVHESGMARGARLEPQAIEAFEYVTGKKVEKVGYCQREDEPRIAYSPDGIIGLTEDIETKCPEAKNYMKIVVNDEVPKEYVSQIVQGFCVNDDLMVRWFVAYNPDISSYPIHIIKCTREEYAEQVEEALAEQRKFLLELDDKINEMKNL